MRSGILYIVFLAGILAGIEVSAQLSPGDLTSAHAKLEGISNCTQCHTLGEKISDEKCLACHKEINLRIDQQSGYHASREVKSKECADCHSEHHGRKFDMVRFDENTFNHNLTGYKITGAHQRVDCRACHKPDLVEDLELRQRSDTYLGLPTSCASCHDDYHQNTLSSNRCSECHTTEDFSPAKKFDHNNTDFALRGQHTEVTCIECHQKEIRNGKEFQVFNDIPYNNCNACHEDAHNNNLGTNCKQCHTEQSFTSLSNIRRFNHSRTSFPLKGAHQRINCSDCHTLNVDPVNVFQDRLGIPVNDCVACHEDVHDDRFGSSCVDCHNENSFQEVNEDNFNHNLTDFHLKGKHQQVDCRQCHEGSFITPMPHNECAACHEDYHEGDFAVTGVNIRDCADCHNEDGFELTLYTLKEHNQSDFPLTGAHLATPCFACHLQNSATWEFRDIGSTCIDCHEDVHDGYINIQYYPDKACTNCHITDNWKDNHFDHNLTGFVLEGVHAEQECMACHTTEDAETKNRYSGFLEISSTCISCHENIHDDQFAENGITDCTRCHTFENWSIDNFNHDKTDFKLEGRHTEIACDACHIPITVNAETITQYKFDSFECVDCHQ